MEESGGKDAGVVPAIPRADSRVRGVAAVVRLVVAVALVAVAPLAPGASDDDQVRFGLVVAFAWLPAVGLVTMVARRRRSHALDLLILAGDLTLLVLVHALLGADPVVIVAGVLLIVATTTYLAGRRAGIVATVAGSVLLLVVMDGSGALDGFAAATAVGLAGALCWFTDAAAFDRSRASAGLRRTLEKSDAILTGVAEAVVVTTPTGRIGQWNRAAERTFGCATDEARGRSCREALALRLDVRELDCSEGCALLTAGPPTDGRGAELGVDVELWRRLPTGQRQPFLATALPVLDASGRVVEVVHSFRDITRLKQADEAKTLFLATASHELKTPLTVIRGFSQLLLTPGSDLGEAERDVALRAIERRASELNGIVDRLLMSSRIEAGRIDLTNESVDIAAALDERLRAFAVASGREITLTSPAPEELPAVWADLNAFTTVVDHLLDNAVKYSPNGGPIAVTVTSDASSVDVAITDEGVGMTADQAASCFQRFWQAEPSDVRRFGGTGIGLYIVRSLVEAMGATITVASAPGEGSTFDVRLRRADNRPEPTAEAERSRQADHGDRSIIREYMRQLGIEVEV